MSDPNWLTTTQVAEAMGHSPWLIRERCRNRTRPDAIPQHLIDRSGRTIKIHKSYVDPIAVPDNVTAFPVGMLQTDINRLAEAILDAIEKRSVQRTLRGIA